MTYVDAQHLLAFLKLYHGQCDGIWGKMSRAAMTEFQTKFGGIAVTGEVNEESAKALRHAVAFWYDEADGAAEESSATELDWSRYPHFTPEEMACKCGKDHAPYCDGYPHEIQPLLMEILERARVHFGRPIIVASGLRCAQHNADSGGVSNSQHMYGEACDLCVVGANPETVLAWFQSQSDVRYAYRISGSDNIHFDIHKVGR